jgi:hypothetical protein
VVEAPYVDEFDGHACFDRASLWFRSELGAQEREQWPIPFPAGGEQVLRDVGEVAVFRHGHFEQARLNFVHSVPDVGDVDQCAEFGHVVRMVPLVAWEP